MNDKGGEENASEKWLISLFQPAKTLGHFRKGKDPIADKNPETTFSC